MSQKVTVQVIKTENAALSDWQIMDEKYRIVFSGNEYFRDDSVTFSLEANKRYFLQISVTEIFNPDTNLYTLVLNNEPVILIKSDSGSGDHLFPFFTGIRNYDNKITGGTTALISDFPWQVYLISGNSACGGSIISDTWILTAAHCTMDDSGNPVPAARMSVIVGANNPFNGLEGKTYFVSEVIVNEGFNRQTLLNDIALLKLKQPINYVNATPVKLVTSDDVAYGATDPGVMSWVTGWGLTNVTPKIFPTSLQKVQLPIITNTQASTVWHTIPSTDIMAGFLNGNRDACNGDSGGPMVVPVIDEYKLAGIVSWGSQNCNTYGAYTRVSAFESWIRSTTGIVKEFRPPVPAGDTLVCQGEVSSRYSVTNVSGASFYEWRILPADAGVVSGNTANATVLWNTGFTGSATLILRVTINNKVSEWSRLNLKVVLNTILVSQSGDNVICAGKPITLVAGAKGYNLNYKWYKNSTLVQSGPSPELTIASTTTDNSGSYSCEIVGYCGTVFSGTMNLTVHPLTRIYYISPDIQAPFGKNVILEVNSEGHDLVYQWQKNNILLDNSNTSRLFLNDLNATDIGLYKATVTGTCGTEISDTIYVYVKKASGTNEPEVLLWPTITREEFNVALSNNTYYNINIYNSIGKIIRGQTGCRYDTKITVNTLPKGLYIVVVFNREFRKSVKLIIE